MATATLRVVSDVGKSATEEVGLGQPVDLRPGLRFGLDPGVVAALVHRGVRPHLVEVELVDLA
jgi:hypothetical protein